MCQTRMKRQGIVMQISWLMDEMGQEQNIYRRGVPGSFKIGKDVVDMSSSFFSSEATHGGNRASWYIQRDPLNAKRSRTGSILSGGVL